MLSVAAAVAALSVGAPALAQSTSALAASTPVRFDHRYQATLRVGVAEGYRFAIRYHDGPEADPCDGGDHKFCAGVAPVMLDVALGFGVTGALELEGRFRMGLTADFDDSRPLQAGLGLRTLTDPDSRLKFTLAAAALLDFTPDRYRAGGDLDVVVRAEETLQYDVERWFGFYVGAGESFGLLRNFSTVVDLTLGLQFRAPP